jgi:hypothetical protein
MSVVQTMIRARTTVQPGGRIAITDPALQSGEVVEVFVLLPAKHDANYRPAVDILKELEGHRLFQTAEEVDHYIREERESWDF